MSTVLQDLRYALRILWKNSGFTCVAVVALALGVGANTTIFSAFNALLLRPFNFPDPDSLVVLWERPPNTTVRNSAAPANFLAVREQNTTFSHLALYNSNSLNLTEGDKEIGVRMALGATPRDIRRMVVGQGMMLAVAGIGLIASYWLMQGLTILLYGVSASDPLTFGLISLLLMLVAFAANYIPARRATKVDPMVALRYE
jgi:hypothetical protein